jgi:MtN3 and saliva related transmembrane protein
MLDALTNVFGADMIGYAAAFCTTSAFLPQAYVAIKYRDTKSLSLAMYIIFTAGLILWLLYGAIKHDWALIAANAITATLAALILLTKLRYDVFGKGETRDKKPK